ncbi:MAG: hypothetical protein ACKOTB_09310, partial [Planctomycetia bacterium]
MRASSESSASSCDAGVPAGAGKVCEAAARAGGRVLVDWIGRFGVSNKGPSDLVTEADFASQR